MWKCSVKTYPVIHRGLLREYFDELLDIIVQMWERSDDPEIDLMDIALPLKAALVIADIEASIPHQHTKPELPFNKSKNKRGIKNTKDRKKFKFFSR